VQARDPATAKPTEGAEDAGPDSPPAGVPLRRVRKSYEQVADQLREHILGGRLSRDERLPTETLLASQLGVSRATVREALRLLAAQNLIRTSKGASGGSYVTIPTVEHLLDYMSSNIGLLAGTDDLTLDELVEARILIEVPAARLAASRRDAEDVERLRAAIPGDEAKLDSNQEFRISADFHTSLVHACHNQLLTIAMRPLTNALQVNLQRSGLDREFHVELHRQHRGIAEAIATSDANAAGLLMQRHLEFLVPYYEQAWDDMRRGR
jgi:DNA-binding FadR family transcriptional regulator